MVRRVSIKDVAEHAGVSWKTVSNVVNERPVVREDTRTRVLQAIEELGYVPNHVGRELRGGPTRSIALVVPELQNPYFARLAERMQSAARERGYTVSVEVSLQSAAMERAHVQGRSSRPVDAVIISPTALEPVDVLDRPGGPRVVLLGESLPAAPDVVHVVIDNVASATDLVRHLVAGGRRRLLFLGADGAVRSTATDRLRGFGDGLREAGLSAPEGSVRPCPSWTREAGLREVHAALDDGLEIDGVVAGNDLLALGALHALAQRGLDVPGDVAVAGWDDIPEAAWARPALTTIAPRLDDLISAALDAALADSSGGQGHEAVVGHDLLVRDSAPKAPPRSPAPGAPALSAGA